MKVLQRVALVALIAALALPALSQDKAADLYKSKCAMCHGADGTKTMMGAKPLSGAEVQGMADADLNAAITNGKGKMPAYKGKLTDAQISELVSYIRTLKK
jgi:cytochrome c6